MTFLRVSKKTEIDPDGKKTQAPHPRKETVQESLPSKI